MRDGNYQGEAVDKVIAVGSEPTYEGWKLISEPIRIAKINEFRAYL